MKRVTQWVSMHIFSNPIVRTVLVVNQLIDQYVIYIQTLWNSIYTRSTLGTSLNSHQFLLPGARKDFLFISHRLVFYFLYEHKNGIFILSGNSGFFRTPYTPQTSTENTEKKNEPYTYLRTKHIPGDSLQ